MIVQNSIGTVGTRIMRLLIGQAPKKMSDLIEATGVTRTAVSEQLNELIANGYVQQKLERLPGRGRPRYLYSATELALKKMFEGYQSVLVPAAWRAIKKHCGNDMIGKVCDEISTELAEYYNRQISASDPEERLREFTTVICQSGRLGAYRIENGIAEYDKLSCPFVSMYDGSGIVCEIDKLAMSKILKAPVERVHCRLEGAPCCTFRIIRNPEDKKGVSSHEPCYDDRTRMATGLINIR